MVGLLPEDIAVVVLGPGGAALGRRLRTALAGARLHGPRAHPGDWDESYDRVSTHIGALFDAGRPIIGVCASGILIRSVAPFLVAKQDEPGVTDSFKQRIVVLRVRQSMDIDMFLYVHNVKQRPSRGRGLPHLWFD